MRQYTTLGNRLNNQRGPIVVWIVIVLVSALAIGPILWLLPSKRDKLVSRFRAVARRRGLVVELVSVPKLDAAAVEHVSAGGKARDVTIQCAALRLPLPSATAEAPCWRLLKSAGESRHLEGWAVLDAVRTPPIEDEYWQRVAAIVDALPGGCVGVEATQRSVSWLGREHFDGEAVETVVAQIAAGLEAIAKLHEELAASGG